MAPQNTDFSLLDLERIISERAASADADSWTIKLINRGTSKAAEKMGEEAVETLIAAVAGTNDELGQETADLLYHLLVLLHMRGVSVAEVMAVLEGRTGQSGTAEKAARPKVET